LQQITALGYYHGAWQTLIQEAKFHGQPFLLERMGLVLADWAMRALPAPDVVIPVPMHEERLLERGFNQAEVLASMIHWRLGLRWQDTLERVLPTTPQVRLSRQERLHNLQGAFRCTGRRREYDTRVWLVDDVTTTGATLNECAKVLRESGYQEIFAVCLAAGLEKSACTVAKMRI
jgi:ComF family protein